MRQLLLDINYNQQQRAIRNLVRDFAEKEIAPGAEERDRTGDFPYDLYRRLGELGITSMRYPREYGGEESDWLSFCLALEEIARVDSSLSVSLMVGADMGIELLAGTKEQIENWKDKYILPLARGEALGCAAITEPGAGSDTRAIQTSAVLEGDEWVINGTKAFITNAGLENCTFVNVVALTDRETQEFTTILVPKGTPGYTIMPKYRKMGWRSSDTRELIFQDCRVPARNVVGARGAGRQRIITFGFARARIGLASNGLGIHHACFDLSLCHAQQRVAFGRPISKFQHVQNMLVEMATQMELSRLIRDKAALLVDCGDTAPMKEAAMAKAFCCESAKKATDFAVQIHGGMGFMDECPVSRYYRDVRILTIADGTTEIQKNIIARELGC